MGDALSVARTAVGIVSLGIQVCQGLITYYSAYKDQDAIILAVQQNVTALLGHLSKTQLILHSLSGEHDSATAQVESEVKRCLTSISALEVTRKKCRDESLSDGIRSQVKRKAQKLSFPFRKETLEDVQKNVGTVQACLHMAISILEL